jgi:UDP-N-acetylmuramoylalanine--D-glutamate ligase
MDLKYKKFTIIGAARSGIAAAEVVLKRGGIPFVSDSGQIKDGSLLKKLQALGIEHETGGHSERIYDGEYMILSPAVPSDSDIILNAKARGMIVWPEIELAYHLCMGKIIGITGSNGKTTTTALIGKILEDAGLKTFICGNIGTPFIGIAEQVPHDGWAVVELSSFQLEQIESFRPNIAVFLNLTPDHLDRHKTIEYYAAAKMRIFENQKDNDIAVVNHDDEMLVNLARQIPSYINWFSTRGNIESGVWAVPGEDVYVGQRDIMKADDIKIKGEHNLSNSCASIAAALGAGVPEENIVETLKSFAGVEHRLEPVRLIGGVSFINDSKGTNVDSVYWALKAVSAPVILIAGGKDKDGDFSALNDMIAKKAKLVVLIGKASDKIEATWKGIVRCVRATTMEDAVRLSFKESKPNDTVLLSPGCASFDMFDNYEHRGRVFKQAVEDLAKEVAI